MTAWGNLVKKELRLGIPAFLMPVIAFIALCLIGLFFGNRYDIMWEPLIGITILATGLQIFYLAYYMLYSLQAEKKKLHLWLHNPLPSYGLLTAKLVAGAASMIVTTILVVTVGFIALTNSPVWADVSEFITVAQLLELGFYGGIALFLMALSISVWIMFFWVIFLRLSSIMHGFLSFIVTGLSALALGAFVGWFSSTRFHETLTQWGKIELGNMLQSIDFETSLEGGTEVTTGYDVFSFYTGTVVYDTMFAIVLFFLACWILDRKIEV
ncbi:hypothetical protein [Bacillus sp. FJAT-45037]|uniref:hypothetical protein n=1 Tax=Bacillus sp. FJAT-45037 TaxID=2011007 RepID=UPI000C24FAB1|nr:hypothetical protein [Bacillus sp. FJAT-45037]